MEIDDTLDDLYRLDALNKQRALSAQAYETRSMKKLLAYFDLEDRMLPMLGEVKKVTGRGSLTFSYFHDQYPSFPVWLKFCRLPNIYKLKVVDLFDKFEKQSFMQVWEDEVEAAPQALPVGVVFELKGLKGSQLVVHNHEMHKQQRGTSFTCFQPKSSCAFRLDKLETLLLDIKSIWTPR